MSNATMTRDQSMFLEAATAMVQQAFRRAVDEMGSDRYPVERADDFRAMLHNTLAETMRGYGEPATHSLERLAALAIRNARAAVTRFQEAS